MSTHQTQAGHSDKGDRLGRIALVTISAAGLAALLLNSDTRARFNPRISAANAVYETDVAGPKYELVPYRVQEGDTLSRLTHGNQALVDYLMERYGMTDPIQLRPNKTILLPVRTDGTSGQTIDELFRSLENGQPASSR